MKTTFNLLQLDKWWSFTIFAEIQCFCQVEQLNCVVCRTVKLFTNFTPRFLRHIMISRIIFSPPEVWSKESVIGVNLLKIPCQMLGWRKVLKIDVWMRRSNQRHVSSIENNRYHIVRQNVEKFFSDIVLKQVIQKSLFNPLW